MRTRLLAAIVGLLLVPAGADAGERSRLTYREARHAIEHRFVREWNRLLDCRRRHAYRLACDVLSVAIDEEPPRCTPSPCPPDPVWVDWPTVIEVELFVIITKTKRGRVVVTYDDGEVIRPRETRAERFRRLRVRKQVR